VKIFSNIFSKRLEDASIFCNTECKQFAYQSKIALAGYPNFGSENVYWLEVDDSVAHEISFTIEQGHAFHIRKYKYFDFVRMVGVRTYDVFSSRKVD